MQPEHRDGAPLQRVLKLKRYERPPPLYFNNVSAHVIASIRAGGASKADSSLGQLEWEAPWLHRLLAAMQAKPIYGWVFAGALCALVVGGVVSLEKPDTLPAGIGGAPTLATAEQPELKAFTRFGHQADVWNSTNPVMPIGGLPFDNFPQPQPVSRLLAP